MDHISHYTETGTKRQSHVKCSLDLYHISMTFASKILELNFIQSLTINMCRNEMKDHFFLQIICHRFTNT